MAEVLVVEFEGANFGGFYQEVNKLLGTDATTGAGDWPPGLVSHVGGESETGLFVVEVWESRKAQEEFMNSRLGPAFEQANVPQPTRIEWFSQIGSMHRH